MNSNSFIRTFILGLICFVVGTLLIAQNITIRTAFYTWNIGGHKLSSGAIFMPLFISVFAIFFVNKNRWFPILLAFCSLIFIVVTVIMGTTVTLARMTMLDYMLIFGSFFVGVACLLRCLLSKPE